MQQTVADEEKALSWIEWGSELKKRLLRDRRHWTFENVSVVLCCKDKAHVLELVLGSLLRQTRKPDFVVLADDHSSDDSVAVFTNFCESISLRHTVVQPERKGVFQLNTIRNLGIEVAPEGLVIVLDADLMAGPGLIEAHLRLHFAATEAVSSVGPLFEAADETGGGPIGFMWGHEPYAHVTHRQLGRVPTWATVLGGNLGIHRSLWRAVGCFDTRYDGNYGVDDQDIHYRFHLADVRHLGDFNAQVIHLPHENVLGSNRRPDINLRKFEDKYGISIYTARHVPEQIDWLGWQYGPWNKLVKRLYAGDPSATKTRGSWADVASDPTDNPTAVVTEDISRSLRQFFDPEYFRLMTGKESLDDNECFSTWLERPDYWGYSPNRYLRPKRYAAISGSRSYSQNPFAVNFLEILRSTHLSSGLFNAVDYVENAGRYGRMVKDDEAFIDFWRIGRHQGIAPHVLVPGGMYHLKQLDAALLDPAFGDFAWLDVFDVEFYQREDRVVGFPVIDYLMAPSNVRRSPNRRFDMGWYRSQVGAELGGVDELSHFLRHGVLIGLTPNPFVKPLPATRTRDEVRDSARRYLREGIGR